ncbi:kinase-like protein [Annulohypoxylon bovei var. microspora]|nr:kinase-like protein [Annulohypoxylon bovei var. microspora]
MADDGLPQTYEEDCQLVSLQFDLFRRAGRIPFWNASAVLSYRNEWANTLLPKPEQPLFWAGERFRWDQEKYDIGSNDYLPDLDNPWSASEPRIQRAKDVYNDARKYFETNNNQFVFHKVLGMGGLGMALHYRYKGVEPFKDVGVKISRNGWIADDIRREENATRAMQRAAHCIQVIDPPSVGLEREKYVTPPDVHDSSEESESSGDESAADTEARPPRRPRSAITAEEQTTRMQRLIDREINRLGGQVATMGISDQGQSRGERKDYMLMEYVEGGSLDNLIRRLQEPDEGGEMVKIPNKVLWSLWLCMVRACVALKYPPRKFHPGRVVESRPDGQTDLIEMVPPENKRWRHKNWVHFDIDPSNIFIGNVEAPPDPESDPKGEKRKRTDESQPDREGGEHSFIPRLKLADFGLARKIKTNKRNIYYHHKRKIGKASMLVPEQYGPDWDLIPAERDGAEVSEQRVAGNYGSPMNVFQMALTMWVVMTQKDTPYPPQAQIPPETIIQRNPEGELPDNIDEIVRTADPNARISWCPLIMNDQDNPYEYIDVEFRMMIWECMYHRQDDRPTVETLLTQARAGCQKQFDGEDDESVNNWVKKFIFDAEIKTGDGQDLD